MDRYRLSRGFTLLEVLVTVAILSCAIIFVFQSFTASLSAARFSQNINLACLLAEDKVWEIEQATLKNINLAQSNHGNQKLQNKDFNWQYEISPVGNQNLTQLNLTVSWQENRRKEEYPLNFITYLPVKN